MHLILPFFIVAALTLFLMSVNIKTPVVVENITLMCLRILQKLIKPPAPTSKKNKVHRLTCRKVTLKQTLMT